VRAARFYSLTAPLVVEDVDEPVLRPGSAIVRVQAAFVPPFIGEVLNGNLQQSLPPAPFTPGFDTIGIVEEVAPDVDGLRVGDHVYCNHAYETQGELGADDYCFIGNFALQANGMNLLKEWPNGSFAERVVLPALCLAPLRNAARFDPALLCRLGWIGTAYGALTRAGLRRGQTVVINGATGLVGTSAVMLALALGARRIVAVGRSRKVLRTLKELDSQCIATVCLKELEEKHASEAIIDATEGGSDIVVDAANAGTPESAMNAFTSLRRGGAMALVSDSTVTLPISYMTVVDRGLSIVGTMWFRQSATTEFIGLVDSGVFDITRFEPTAYDLDHINEAIKAAATSERGLHHIAYVA